MFTKTNVLWACLCPLIGFATFCTAAEKIRIETREPIGVHRDSAIVHIQLKLPRAVPSSTPFRLMYKGMPQVAQFRPASGMGNSDRWWLDFMTTSLPFQARQYEIEYGDGVEASKERTSGHRLIEQEGQFVVSNAPYIAWTIRKDLLGLLKSVNFRPSEHLRRDSPGLGFRDDQGNVHPLGGKGVKASILRKGRMTVGLRFEKKETSRALRDVHWSADLIFPGPVSWMDLRLTVHDPSKRVVNAELQLNLKLDPPTGGKRTLVELGASRTIYRSLLGKAEVMLQASGKDWQVSRGLTGMLAPFVVSGPKDGPAEGWAHVMDRKRCLAIAFDRFGIAQNDRIKVEADGTFSASREFDDAQPKQWRMWLHFVHFPPAQSASTDPRMMQSPLIVRQLDGK